MKNQTKEEEIAEAIKDYQDAMLENIKVSREEVNIVIKKRSIHYKLLKAKERLTSLEWEALTDLR